MIFNIIDDYALISAEVMMYNILKKLGRLSYQKILIKPIFFQLILVKLQYLKR